ncbi:CLUMA_CG020152, isoform A [Clunio marinus]|uniref:Phenoloxidase-activating factor 2 n=1 Tax=Clunio marinus TaxID=568069 RepID=A0A1J1J5W2_9DIPT|nr:CLUMA_CG020152, isoform A [Clunio marinus]
MLAKFCHLAFIVSVFSQSAQEKGNLDDLIGDVFGSNEPTDNSLTDVVNEKLCNGGLGECVPYYLCVNGTINTDGSDLLDIRFGEGQECVDYFEQCCSVGQVLPQPQPPKTPVQVQSQCGFRNAEGVGFRITGNSDGESEYGEFPWMVAILKEEIAAEQVLNVYQCGGSLIHPSVVLTAAHCVQGKTPSALKVRAGEWDTQTKNELFPHTDHDVQDLIIHQQYYKGGLHNDIALLFLKNPVQLEQHINTVCLPSQDTVFDGSRCFASGWGKDVFGKEGKYQVILKKIDLPIVPHIPCEESLRKTRLGRRFNLHHSFICAGGEPGKDTCNGDGGSPLVCPVNGHDGHYYQAGIVAWGIGCGENGTPGVYVNVARFRHWIDEQLKVRGMESNTYNI